MEDKIGRLEDLEDGGGLAERTERLWAFLGKTKMCKYKSIIEECLFPTGSVCEECNGYDLFCRDYVAGERK